MFKFSVLILSVLMSASAFAANQCNEGRAPNFPYPAGKAATAILEKHELGEAAPEVNYAGTGYCYKAPKAEGVSMEESFAYVGRFRGTAEAAYLLKQGGLHTVVHRGWVAYVGDNECPLVIAEDNQQAQKQLVAGINQQGDIHMIPDGLGLSLVVPSVSTYIICYFPIR